MNQVFKLSIFVLTILFFHNYSFAQERENYVEKIDNLLKSRNPRNFNGVVYILQKGQLKYAKAYGFADFDKRMPLKINDRFSTMSIAKQFTAALILRQVEQGTIDLQVPIRTYLPDFKYAWADTVTVHQLLNNTSGLNSDSMDEPLKFQPGSAFNYSNIGYYVAGLVLEKQSGEKFEKLVAELFRECKMKDSYYPNEASNKFLVKGHNIKNDKSFVLKQKSGFDLTHYFGSHLIVTAPDIARWNECLHKGKVLKPETYKMMTDYVITSAHPVFGEKPIGYAYGLRINDKADIYEIGHTGFHPAEGFTAVNLYYPKTETSIVIMENVGNENFEIAYFYELKIRDIVKQSTLLR